MTTPNNGLATELVTLTLTNRQLCVIAALAHHKEQLIQASGKESGRALLSEHVTVLGQEQDRDALTQSTQAALSRLETAITLEFYRVTFTARNYTDESLKHFKTALRETFPTYERFVCTLWDYGNNPPGKPNDLGFRVYVPATEERPDMLQLMWLVAELKGVQFDSVSDCWLGERTTASDDSWTVLV